MKAMLQSEEWRMLALACVLSLWPLAPGASEQDRVRDLRRDGSIVPLEQITAEVRTRYAGTILEVELESKRQRHFYEVEVLDEAGVVRKLLYDASTGELLKEERDD